MQSRARKLIIELTSGQLLASIYKSNVALRPMLCVEREINASCQVSIHVAGRVRATLVVIDYGRWVIERGEGCLLA